jgi:hypothetical protein
MERWRLVLPRQPIPWGWGMWSRLNGPSHFLAENEKGERAYVSLEEIEEDKA